MTEDNFKRAIQIHKELTHLNYVKDMIFSYEDAMLVYAIRRNGEYDFMDCWDAANKYIEDILKKHDTQIRQEIEDKINKLNNEIKKL